VEELHQHAQKLVDQAVSKNLIHANKASRINSRMAQKLNK
ncbi:30S ribosomal protein S20, partial [Streptococcus anginosus]